MHAQGRDGCVGIVYEYLGGVKESKRTILFFARDPGGVNAILPVYQKMKGHYHAIIYAKDFGLKMLGQENVFVHDIEAECNSQSAEQIMLFLSRVHPDIVITGTSLDDYTERFLWKACAKLHIKSFAVLDQWMNLGIRFSEYGYGQDDLYRLNPKHSYLPYKILVMDELAKQDLVKDGIAENRICITGQPHFDVVADKYERAKEIYGDEAWNVVYVSEPIIQDYDNNDEANRYWGYNERTIFFHLYHSLQKLAEEEGRQVRLVIRPHPRENAEYWESLAVQMQTGRISLECDREKDSFDIIKSADLICGMSSMFLLEAAICRKPIVSIMIGLKRKNPFVLDEIGICKSILSEGDLYEQLRQISNHEDFCLDFESIKGAANQVCALVGGEMSDEEASDSWRK